MPNNFFITLLFIALSSKAQSAMPHQKIDSIKSEYSIGDSITLHFSNLDDENFYISIGLERKEQDKWIIITDDIFRHSSALKVQTALVLKANTIDRREVWEIKDYPTGTYRLIYNTRSTNTKKRLHLYSNACLYLLYIIFLFCQEFF